MSRVVLRSASRAAVRSPQPRWLYLRASLNPWGALAPRHQDIRSHSTSSTSPRGSSVSASEVSHFTQLASSWWDPHGPSRLLHLMNPLRHDFIKSCVVSSSPSNPSNPSNQPVGTEQEKPKGSYTFLDIGCGGGIFASSAARLPTTRSVTAIDPTPEVIVVANRHKRSDPLLSQPGRLTYLNCAIEDLASHVQPQPQSALGPGANLEKDRLPGEVPQYDFVTLFEVIEHISHPAAFLRTCLSHLRPGGYLIGSTIARHPLSCLTTKIIAEAPWPIGVVPHGTHDWDKYINPAELRQFFAKENVKDFERGRRTGEKEAAESVKVVEGRERLESGDLYAEVRVEGCVYLPGVGWKFVNGSEEYGNYFFGVRKLR